MAGSNMIRPIEIGRPRTSARVTRRCSPVTDGGVRSRGRAACSEAPPARRRCPEGDGAHGGVDDVLGGGSRGPERRWRKLPELGLRRCSGEDYEGCGAWFAKRKDQTGAQNSGEGERQG